MQLYEVKFKIENEHNLEIGKCIVTGENEEEAVKKVNYHLGIESTCHVSYSVNKLKPQIYQIDRVEIPKQNKEISEKPNILPINKEAPQKKFKATHIISINAEVEAVSSAVALRILNDYLKSYNRNPNAKDDRVSIFELDFEERNNFTRGLQSPYIDKQSIYKNITVYKN